MQPHLRPHLHRRPGRAGPAVTWLASSALPALLALLASLLSIGCKSGGVVRQPYVSPQVTGRVVDASTQAPIVGARVTRFLADDPFTPTGSNARGAQKLTQPAPAVTGPDGGFTLRSIRALTFFTSSTMPAVPIRVTHPGYRTLTTNLPIARVFSPDVGSPILEAGDVPLEPRE